MKLDIFRFYLACLKRAFSGWFKQVEGWASTLSLLVGIVLQLLSHSPKVDQIAISIPSYFFLGMFALGLLYRLICAPYWMFRDEKSARQSLEQARLPALILSLPQPPVIQSISLRGRTSETVNGNRQTSITDWRMDVVALVCVNRGETTARNCRARLLSVTKLLPDGENAIQLVESIELPWKKESPEENLVTDIPASDTRRVWIGGVRERGQIWLFRQLDKLPIEYQQLLGGPGTYRLLIQIDAENIPPQQTILEIISAEGPKPQVGIMRGMANVAIVAMGSPSINIA